MLPHSGGKSLKYNIVIRAISMPTAIAAYSTETINVIVRAPTVAGICPISAESGYPLWKATFPLFV